MISIEEIRAIGEELREQLQHELCRAVRQRAWESASAALSGVDVLDRFIDRIRLADDFHGHRLLRGEEKPCVNGSKKSLPASGHSSASSFACLLAARQIIGCPRQRGNLRRIRQFVIQHWDLLDAAIAAVSPAVPPDQKEADHAPA